MKVKFAERDHKCSQNTHTCTHWVGIFEGLEMVTTSQYCTYQNATLNSDKDVHLHQLYFNKAGKIIQCSFF
jgi:hypothetical protein